MDSRMGASELALVQKYLLLQVFASVMVQWFAVQQDLSLLGLIQPL